jgi:dTDP-4-dehydrorhamnose reductase
MLWITGGYGLLGSALYTKCKAAIQNPKNRSDFREPLSKCKAGPQQTSCFLGSKFSEVIRTGREVDISNRESVRAFVKEHPNIRYIVNCAAFCIVDAAELQKEDAFKTNAIGPENLSLIAEQIGAKFIHISTDYVFAGDRSLPWTELDPTVPCNYYGESKLEGEKRILDPSTLIIRTSWIFGSRGKNFVSKLLEMVQTQKEIRLTNDQWSRFTYAPDLAEAILVMLDQSGLFHYANEGVTTKYEFGLALLEEAKKLGFHVATESLLAVPSSYFPSPCKRPVYSAFDTKKIEQFISIRNFRSALKGFLCEQLPAYL